MKPFLHDPAITNPLDVARHGLVEIFIKPITDHTCEESWRRKCVTMRTHLNLCFYLRGAAKLHDHLTTKSIEQVIFSQIYLECLYTSQWLKYMNSTAKLMPNSQSNNHTSLQGIS